MPMKKGDRFELTEDYFRQFPRTSARTGVVVGRPRQNADTCVRVKLDGYIDPKVLSEKFLRPVN